MTGGLDGECRRATLSRMDYAQPRKSTHRYHHFYIKKGRHREMSLVKVELTLNIDGALYVNPQLICIGPPLGTRRSWAGLQ
jgi:hypothetical protein